ncbi:neuronal acetylcholine receptor subunit alpha-7-like [Dendronephthya gigantea]|uniref:neuronal acetylcholine receptor subunit alpha-7-like n=1 Tax=Dendronephthya gigantea TaxID=151771 RepID=UPI00106ABE2E|nr:neuronal acetylcholine receptor subunit alpha-7-like [Dendronephthya gigantea]XP_028410154.1 neuronal acetylcholine receptor subunit alpha-7-like [Dendronephthya gigantea]
MAQNFVMKLYCTLLCIAVMVSCTSGLDRQHYEAQKRLIDKIINESETTKQILPMDNESKPVILGISIGIRQIATVDEVNQALRLNVWLRLDWNNSFVTWDPTEYGNVTSIHIDNSKVWTPDIAMYNKASLEEEIDILYTRLSTSVIIRYDGNCQWLSPVTLLSQCRINVRRFPFDEQECLLVFGSWTYSADKIDVKSKGADLDNFLPNGEWTVKSSPMKRNIKVYPGGTSYADVTLRFHIKRQPLYYTLNLILPCTVIAILAFLSFVLPSNHGERVSLVITVLLAMSVYMLIVSSTLPQTSDAMPVIGTYFLCIIVEIALCLLATCFVAKIRDHETEIPRWFDHLVNKRMAKFLLLRNTIEDYEEVPKTSRKNGHSKNVDISLTDVKIPENEVKFEVTNQRIADKLREELSVLTSDVSKRQKRNARQRKWQNAARVLDRFFLLFFSFVFVVVTASVFS